MSSLLLRGDCLQVMQALRSQSVDAVVTDPPYGLEFMGKEWDKLEPNRSRYKGQERDFIGEGDGTPHRRNRGTPSFASQERNPKCAKCDRYQWDHVGRKCDCAEPDFRRRGMGREQYEWHLSWATEVYRVLKPGGYLLAFGGTRTFHRLTCAIEDAGFEIRDCLSWMYGSGFPKSLDVSKAMDKVAPRAGMFDAFAQHFAEQRRASGLTQKQIAVHFPSKTGGLTGCVWNWENGANVPTLEQWAILQPLLNLSNEYCPLIERVEAERQARMIQKEADLLDPEREIPDVRRDGGNRTVAILGTEPTEYQITAPATDLAKQWDGWGTALKPGWEPIILARKPLVGTVASNVAQFGTGAINVDATRISGEPWKAHRATGLASVKFFTAGEAKEIDKEPHTAGRWPANVVLSHTEDCRLVGSRKVKGAGWADTDTGKNSDHVYAKWDKERTGKHYAGADGKETVEAWECSENCPVRLLDEQSGERKAGIAVRRNGISDKGMFAIGNRGAEADVGYGDTGGASRFFYTAKASRAEREAGLEGMPRKPVGGHLAQGDKRMGRSAEEGANTRETPPAANAHPTVKPLALMRWLCRLVTPPNGIILDPFAGSFSTGCAAVLEGFSVIGIERELEYLKIGRARVRHWERVALDQPLSLEIA